jgi:LysE type translocator
MAGVALPLANPQSVTYWMALGRGLEAILAHVPTQRDYLVFFAEFMLACLAFCYLAAGLVVGIRRVLTDRWYRSLNVVCGLALLAFALLLAYGTLENAAPRIAADDSLPMIAACGLESMDRRAAWPSSGHGLRICAAKGTRLLALRWDLRDRLLSQLTSSATVNAQAVP